MLQKLRALRGQSTLEYAVLVVIVIAALLSLQMYIKRGVQGRLRSATDDIGDQYTASNLANYYKIVNSVSSTTERFEQGVSSTALERDRQTNTYIHMNANTNGEYWGN